MIFLDVDGELTYSGYENPATHHIDENKVILLKEIVQSTNAIIVLSSSWKIGYDKETGVKRKYYQVLENTLNKYGLQIFDLTDDIRSEIINYKPTESMSLEDITNIHCKYGTGRGAEVIKWITDHNPESFVILDDENHDWVDYGLKDNWIRPSWYDKDGGLHREHVEKAIEILNA